MLLLFALCLSVVDIVPFLVYRYRMCFDICWLYYIVIFKCAIYANRDIQGAVFLLVDIFSGTKIMVYHISGVGMSSHVFW